MAANKGAVALRFNFEDTSFLFVNTHLTSGQKKVKERVADLNLCYEEACSVFSQNEMSSYKHISGIDPCIPDKQGNGLHDYSILFGDMNFRCDLSNLEA